LTIVNSTISGNSAGVGGGIWNDGRSNATLTIVNSTLSDNSGPFGGGIYNQSATLTIGDTILKAGASGPNILNQSGTVNSLGYNLSSDNGGGVLTGTGDQINTDPVLGPLQDNGGPTLTHALLLGSPAIDAGDPNFTPPPNYDQRGPGFDRVVNGRIDIGSFEMQATPTPTPTPTASPTCTPGETMYGGNGRLGGGALIIINQTNGTGTVVGTPVSGVGLTGIAFHPDGRLFASTISSTSTLIQVNPDTGALIATIGTITDNGTPIGIGDLSFQPGTGVLY